MRIGVAAVVLAVATGCAPSDRPSPVPPGGVSVTPTAPAPSGAEVTVRGTVRNGVEPGCLVLAAPDREYLLVRPVPELKPGVEAVVRGSLRPGAPTTCMQGTPLTVRTAEVAGSGS